MRREPRPFRFESAWLTHPDFQRTMNENWQSGTCLEDNLASMKGHLHSWSRNVFGSVRKKKAHLLARLEGIQRRQANGTMHRSLYELESSLQAELQDILYQEELMWYERSRAKWMQDGDRNTKYYHLKATSRKKKNRILMLRDADGNWMEEESQIKTHASNFFLDLFTDNEVHDAPITMKYHFTRLDDATATNLGCEVKDNEIDDAVHSMQPWKAPGPDGFQAGFYHHNWAQVRADCYGFVKHIWAHPESVSNVNDTDICLIPKVPKPEFITQFRPISLCNVNYKIITKIIVSRLKPLMPQIISLY